MKERLVNKVKDINAVIKKEKQAAILFIWKYIAA